METDKQSRITFSSGPGCIRCVCVCVEWCEVATILGHFLSPSVHRVGAIEHATLNSI